jgi:hypothetical protein
MTCLAVAGYTWKGPCSDIPEVLLGAEGGGGGSDMFTGDLSIDRQRLPGKMPAWAARGRRNQAGHDLSTGKCNYLLLHRLIGTGL